MCVYSYVYPIQRSLKCFTKRIISFVLQNYFILIDFKNKQGQQINVIEILYRQNKSSRTTEK